MRNHRTITAIALALGATVLPAAAGAAEKPVRGETERFSETYSGIVDCGDFQFEYAGTGHWAYTPLLDSEGEQVGGILRARLSETETNLSTGESLRLRQSVTDRTDFASDTRTITGVVWIGNEPGAGTYVLDTGRSVLFGPDKEPLFLAGPHEVLAAGLDPLICEALR